MKKTVLFLAFISGLIVAQNNVPVITNITADPDTAANIVDVQFDVSDAENDSLEIWLEVSDDNGLHYLVPTQNVSGAVGFPIMPGTNKHILWNYSAITNPQVNFKVKVIANDRKGLTIQEMVDMVDTNNLLYNMSVIEGMRHYSAAPVHLQEVRDTIEARFTSAGFQTSVQGFTVSSITGENIIGNHAGWTHEEDVIIIDGHYDGVDDGPAADDNGSAVIGVLEAARILSQSNFKKSIRFIGFDMEELGLLGSGQYVNTGMQSYDNLLGVLNFEMIGYYSERNGSQQLPTGFNLLFPAAYAAVLADTSKGNFIINVANTNSSPLKQAFDSCAAAYVPSLRVISIEAPGNSTIAPDLRRSDHAQFWDAGYKALMITDGANFRNHNYHTINDVSDSLNFEFIQKVVQATLATAAQMAIPIHAGNATTDVIIPNMISSITTDAAQVGICVYPNPADDELKIELKNNHLQIISVTITDIHGKICREISTPDQSFPLIIKAGSLPGGSYFINFNSVSGSWIHKLMVVH